MTIRATLTFIFNSGRLLLIRKKAGFGAGKINGIGGKINDGESPYEAATREVLEEVGVSVYDLRHAGVLYFYSTSPTPDWEVFVYTTNNFEGQPIETDEALPVWVSLKSIPFEEMWEDDRHWLPHVLAGNKVEGHFFFNQDYSRLKGFRILVY